MSIYEPAEDSYLLEKYVKKYAKGICLDIGTGTGIQALAASKKADFVIAVDINQEALTYCNGHIHSDKILLIHSDLFSVFEKKEVIIVDGIFKGIQPRKKGNKFDTIIFNAPYLPEEKEPELALDGGKEGHEIIDKFLKEAKAYLSSAGCILLIFSSATGKEKVGSLMDEYGYKAEMLESIHIFFEDISCYRLANG